MSTVDGVLALSPRARRRRILRRRFLRRPAAVAGLVVVVGFATVAIFAPYSRRTGRAPPTSTLCSRIRPAKHLLGTDELGRDVLSRIIWGSRASMQAGLLATLLAMLVAVPIGMVAGYYRGWIDTVIARSTDVLLAFPFLILASGWRRSSGRRCSTRRSRSAIACVPGLIRIARGEMLSLREADFVPAAVANGAGDFTIIFRHILPNMTSTLLVQATVTIPIAIIGEAALSFLGLGVQPPTASWGVMLQTRSRTSRRRRAWPSSRARDRRSPRSRSTCSATGCATSSIRGRRADGRAAARGRATSRSGSTRTTGRSTRSTGMSFTLDAGEVLGIVGESGCGKSVTCMSLVRLLPRPPSSAAASCSTATTSSSLPVRRAAAGARPRDLVRLPGADDVAQPRVHGRAADRRGAAQASRALAMRPPRARTIELLRARPHPRSRAAPRRVPAPALGRDAPARDDRDGARLRPEAARSPTSPRPRST